MTALDKERKSLRERISVAWREFPTLARNMAAIYLERYPDDGLVWAFYGDSLRALGVCAEARTALYTARGIVDRDDNKAFVYRLLGELDQAIGDYRNAEGWYRQAIELEPAKGLLQLFLGVTLRRQGRDPEAEACYRKALTLDGDQDEYLVNLGFILQARGDLKEAARCFSDALVIDPNYEEARHSLEDVRQAMRFLEEATRGDAAER
jgi:Flp pilus assembly protein TadD